jgi:hypothetical protein
MSAAQHGQKLAAMQRRRSYAGMIILTPGKSGHGSHEAGPYP